MIERTKVYESIDSERDYQDLKWGSIKDRPHEVGAWITLMIAVGVACLEQHGSPGRSAHQEIISQRK